jgi:hypothetical protein
MSPIAMFAWSNARAKIGLLEGSLPIHGVGTPDGGIWGYRAEKCVKRMFSAFILYITVVTSVDEQLLI